MGCLNSKEEADGDDDSHLVNGSNLCCSSCFSSTTVCKACSRTVQVCSIKTCHDCSEIHCSSCLCCDNSRQGNIRVCSKCLFLSLGQFMPQDLMAYSVRELRQFLFRKEIAVDNCKEKADLIELVMLLSSSSEYLSNLTQHSQHVHMLRERMQQLSGAQSSPSNLLDSASPSGIGESARDSRQPVSTEASVPGLVEKLAASEEACEKCGPLSPTARQELEVDKEDGNEDLPAVRNCWTDNFVEVDNQFTEYQNVSSQNPAKQEESLARDMKTASHVLDSTGNSPATEFCYMELGATNNNTRSRQGNNARGQLCLLCSKTRMDCVFLECGHMVMCYSCGERVEECPICLNYITRRVRAFRA